jgi:hypothetical protein
VKLRSQKGVQEQIRRLASANPDEAEEALRSLLVADPEQKIRPLLAALESTDRVDLLLKILFILEGVRDCSTLDALRRFCEFSHPMIRAAAVRALRQHELEDCVEWVRPLLQDPAFEVQQESLRTLSNYVKAEVPGGKELLLERVLDEKYPTELRCLAMESLRFLETSQFQEVLERLKKSEDARIYAAALHCEEETRRELELARSQKLEQWIGELRSEDVGRIFEAIQQLKRVGKPAASALVAAMVGDVGLTGPFVWAKVALKEMGGLGHEAVLHHLMKVRSIQDYKQFIVVMGLLDVLADYPSKKMEKSLLQLLARFRTMRKSGLNVRQLGILKLFRVGIHSILAGIGSREALDDLLKLLEPRTVGEFDPLGAIEKIGDRRAFMPLLDLYGLEKEKGLPSRVRRIKKVFRKIAVREGIRSKDPMFQHLRSCRRNALKEIFG